jgi:Holliday junction resolvase RusA-like endonuclease
MVARFNFDISDKNSKTIQKELLSEYDEKTIKRALEKYNKLSKDNDFYEIEMTIICDEILAQPRPRGRIMYKGKKPFVHIYDPTINQKWKELLAETIRKELDNNSIILQGELFLDLTVYKPYPINTSRVLAYLLESGLIKPEKIPDFDNYEKSICDALKGVFWKDDSQIINSKFQKFYSKIPRIEFKLSGRLYRMDK